MGPGFLIDTNVAIAYFNQTLPERGIAFIDTLLPSISVITRIELLGWHQITVEELNKINAFISEALLYRLSEPIVQQTITLRQSHKIKTPDAIIAATALVHELTLLTRNIADFKQIPGLRLTNPYDL